MNTAPDLLTEELSVNPIVAQHLKDTAKWTRFVSIFIFIVLGFVFLAILVGSAYLLPAIENAYPVFRNMGGLLLAIVGMAVALLAVINWFLLKFSINAIQALRMQQQALLQSSMSALKVYLMISGFFSILSLLFELINLITAF